MERESQYQKFIKQLTSALPLITFIVLMLGIVKQFTYYYFFNFNVFPFTEIIELLPQTIFDLIFFFLYLLLAILFELPIVRLLNRTNNSAKKMEPDKTSKSWLKISPENLWLIFCFVVIYSQIYMLIGKNSVILVLPWLEPILNFSIFFSTLLFINTIIQTIYTYFDLEFDRRLPFIVAISVLMPLNGLFNGYANYKRVVSFHTHTGYSITVDKKQIVSNKQVYYIGKTKSDVFFFDEKTKLVTVYPTSSITEMQIGKE